MDHADIWFTEHLLQNCLLAIYRVHESDPQHATIEKKNFSGRNLPGFRTRLIWGDLPADDQLGREATRQLCMFASTLDCKRFPRGVCLSGCQAVYLQSHQKDKSTFERNRGLHHVQLLPLLRYQIPLPLQITSL